MKLNAVALERELSIKVEVFPSLSSTLDYCEERIAQGSAVSDLVIACHQTKGRGRTGKSFYSPADTGLYLTLCFPKHRLAQTHLTPRCAVALMLSIQEVFGLAVGVKWVNDLYVQGRKVAGLLLRSVGDRILVSAGVNVEMPPSVPSELEGRFGALTKSCDPALYHKLVTSFYRSLCIHLGTKVRLLYNGEEIDGRCIGIDRDFSLVLDVFGERKSFSSGILEIHV